MEVRATGESVVDVPLGLVHETAAEPPVGQHTAEVLVLV